MKPRSEASPVFVPRGEDWRDVPWYGRLCFHLIPFRRRIVLGNLRRVFGETMSEEDIQLLARSYWAHYARFFVEWGLSPFRSKARKRSMVRVENIDSPLKAHKQGKGILLLTAHFGNWEVATVSGIGQYPQFKGLLHFVRRPMKPKWFNEFLNRRFWRAGFGVVNHSGSLDRILDLLAEGNLVVFVFDQHAAGREGVVVDFCGHPASTFKSLAILALNTGAPVIPTCTWRESDGSHVLRFEDPLPLLEHEDVSEEIRLNTRAYNEALENMLMRHPEQWIWMHRRWKV
jgi:KDO2-lipid IV(A) lauroyltransferase